MFLENNLCIIYSNWKVNYKYNSKLLYVKHDFLVCGYTQKSIKKVQKLFKD